MSGGAERKTDNPMEDEESDDFLYEPKEPLMEVADRLFLLGAAKKFVSDKEKKTVKEEILKLLREHNMAPLYAHVHETLGWKVDQKELAAIKEKNAAAVVELEEKVENTKKKEGNLEIANARLDIAHHYYNIGDRKEAVATYEARLKETTGGAHKIDIVFRIIRLALVYVDLELLDTWISRADELVEAGGDWERRNKFVVYRSIYLLIKRRFVEAYKCMEKAVATFMCSHLFSYPRFISFAVLTALISVDRVTLKDKILESPDVLSVIRDTQHLYGLMKSLYECRYKDFFNNIVNISTYLARDRFLAPHIGWYIRELRITAYNQYLAAYKSVTIESMAKTFGVSVPFIDGELARFISSGRVQCKIDKVNGVVETRRTNSRSAQYEEMLSKGDILISRIQKLTKLL